jgi:FKBP-type peptidyl-prolyl cis-trans isomerase
MLEVLSLPPKGCRGRFPQFGEKVKVGYVIKTEEGRAIDWSRKPLTFILGDFCAPVIEGFHYVLPNVELGSRVKAWVPAEYGFGWDYPIEYARNENLIIEITLLKIKKLCEIN